MVQYLNDQMTKTWGENPTGASAVSGTRQGTLARLLSAARGKERLLNFRVPEAFSLSTHVVRRDTLLGLNMYKFRREPKVFPPFASYQRGVAGDAAAIRRDGPCGNCGFDLVNRWPFLVVGNHSTSPGVWVIPFFVTRFKAYQLWTDEETLVVD